MIKLIKKGWSWIRSLWFIGSNLVKILEGQKEIKERLSKIEETVKSPQYQLAELEKIKTTIDLLKENNEQEKRKLERGSQEEIDKHKAKIAELVESNEELLKYKGLIMQVIGIVKQKNIQIEQLNKQIEQLNERVPSALSLALAGRIGRYPYNNVLEYSCLKCRQPYYIPITAAPVANTGLCDSCKLDISRQV